MLLLLLTLYRWGSGPRELLRRCSSEGQTRKSDFKILVFTPLDTKPEEAVWALWKDSHWGWAPHVISLIDLLLLRIFNIEDTKNLTLFNLLLQGCNKMGNWDNSKGYRVVRPLLPQITWLLVSHLCGFTVLMRFQELLKAVPLNCQRLCWLREQQWLGRPRPTVTSMLYYARCILCDTRKR